MAGYRLIIVKLTRRQKVALINAIGRMRRGFARCADEII